MTSLNLSLWYATSKTQFLNYTVFPPLKTLSEMFQSKNKKHTALWFYVVELIIGVETQCKVTLRNVSLFVRALQ